MSPDEDFWLGLAIAIPVSILFWMGIAYLVRTM